MHARDSAVVHAAAQLESYLTDVTEDDARILRDKQVDVMKDLQTFLQTHVDVPHGYISLPTGVGKTILFTELVKATDLKTLILTPTQGLLDQTEQAFQRFGDQTAVGKVYTGEKNSDERITLSTYASFVSHTKKDSRHIAPGMFDLIILDEAHRAMAAETKRALSKYDDAIQIGFTATEDYSDRRRLQSLLPTEIHKMTIKEAVNHHLITPFANVVVKTGVNMSKVRVTATNEYDSKDLEKVLNTDTRNNIALKLYQQQFAGEKTIIFCNGIKHAQAVADVFSEAGISAMAIHGGLSLDEQIDAKAALGATGSGSIEVLTNDKILAEGFDVPEVSVCINMTPTLSRVRAQQRGGRVLRLNPAHPNKIATVVDFLDESYQKSPVLFSDPRVAEQAQVGISVTSSELLAGADVQELNIIVDPQIITDMARTFYESHRVERVYAPEGWLSAGQIKAIYGLDNATIHNSFSATVKKTDPSQFGQFHNPHINHRSRRNYYSPSIIRELVEFYKLDYIDATKQAPEGWTTKDDYESLYTPRVIKSMYQYTRKMYADIWADHSLNVEGVDYYAPRLQQQLTSATHPEKYWESVLPLMEKYDIDSTEAEDLIRKLAKREAKLSSASAIWCFVEGHEQMFTFPVVYKYLENELQSRLEQSHNRPTPLTDGEVVIIRQAPKKKRANIGQLIRLFEQSEESKRVAAKPSSDRQKALDALYAEFS